MTTLLVFISLLFPEPLTTDDTWDCYISDGTEVCERELNPCHYEHSPDECVVRVVKLPTRIEEVQ